MFAAVIMAVGVGEGDDAWGKVVIQVVCTHNNVLKDLIYKACGSQQDLYHQENPFGVGKVRMV